MMRYRILLFLAISVSCGFVYAHHEQEFDAKIEEWVDLYEVTLDLENFRRYYNRVYEPGLITMILDSGQLVAIVSEEMQLEKVTEQMSRTNNPFYRVVFIKTDGERLYVDHDGMASNVDKNNFDAAIRMLSYVSPEGVDLNLISKVVVQAVASDERIAMIAERDKSKIEKNSRIKELVSDAIFPELIIGAPYEFKINMPEGGVFDSRDYVGKVLLIDMWSTGCGPCYKMFPKLNDFHKKYSRTELEILGVAMFDTEEMMSKVVEKHNLMWLQTNLSDSDFVWANWESMGMVAMPTYLVLDQKGILRKVVTGSNSEQELFESVEALLN